MVRYFGEKSSETVWIVCTQAHVHQLAIAAGDVYVRMYDRRMLSTGEPLQACAWPAGRSHHVYQRL